MIIRMKPRGRHTAQHDARKTRAGKGAAAPRHVGPRAPRGSHAAGGDHYRRRAGSRRRRRARRIVACAAALALVFAACFWLLRPWGGTPPDQAHTASRQEDPAADYDRAVALVNQADETIVPLSKMVSQKLDDSLVKRIEGNLAGHDAARSLLDEAASCLDSAEGGLSGDARERARTLADSVAARSDMLAYGAVVLNASVGAYRASDDVAAAWDGLLSGHDELQKASALVTEGTTKSVKAALRHDRRALARFQEAIGRIGAVADAAPKADLSAERAYADLQVQVAQAAVQTDQALLGEDSKRAQAHNAEYLERGRAAAKAAKALPASADDLVKSVYYSLGTDDISVKDAENRYNAAAKRAAEDDRTLARSTGTSKES